MLLRAAGATAAVLAWVGIVVGGGCGSRTGLRVPTEDAGIDAAVDAPAPECERDTDCAGISLCSAYVCSAGQCITAAPLDCDDGDECTEDRCDELTGECVFAALSRDEDGDGFFGPRPGYAVGQPGACGDDCDDTSPLAFPGGTEVCDGVDNDCNGVVDDNASYRPVPAGDVRISGPSLRQSGAGGLVYGDSHYVATYAGQEQRWRTFGQGLTADGAGLPGFPETAITNINSDSFSGPVVWTGAVFATVWEDRRDNDYEIYFNRLDPLGNKLGPDQRISSAVGFSLNPSLVWNGSQYVVLWQEERNTAFVLIGALLDSEANLIGEVQQLTLSTNEAESPRVAEGDSRLGVVFNRDQGFGPEIGFMTLSPDLSEVSQLSSLDVGGAVDPSIAWLGDRFVVAWERRMVSPGDAIWGATVDEAGNVLMPPTPLTSGASFARSHALIPLGDRVLLIWADDADGNFELYSKMLGRDLEELTPRERLTFDGADTLDPLAAFGPDGDLGVLFDDRRDGAWQVYFTKLECQAGP